MLVNYDVEERRKGKMKSNDRILILQIMEGKTALNTYGYHDKRIFNGENKLHAVYDDMKGTWSMYFDAGGLAGGLQNQFTTFPELLEHTRNYFKRRNIDIIRVEE